jgi:hypothetical protein
MAKYEIQSVVVHKPMAIEKAKKAAKKIIGKDEYRETDSSYRFKNMSKKMFDPSTFKTKIINKNISLVVGKCKKENYDLKEHKEESEKRHKKDKDYNEMHDKSLMDKIDCLEKMIKKLSHLVHSEHSDMDKHILLHK